jgi:tetratricopeptide (TPR) repeat protein
MSAAAPNWYAANLAEHFKLLLALYSRPAAAVGGILDRGSLLFACVSVLLVSLAPSPVAYSFYLPLLLLAVLYVPGVLILSRIVVGLGGSLGAVFQRDYAPLLTCTATAWTAANIPFLATISLPPQLRILTAGFALFYFAFLMFFVVRTVFGSETPRAIIVVGLSWIPLVAAPVLWGPLQFMLGWLASPFFLFIAWRYLGGELGNLGAGLRTRQNYRRMLDAATVNPHDGEAQYQLGLIYQERRQYTEAIQRFQKAVTIDREETDAHFQLGRIAREQGRLEDARTHLLTVLQQDPKHSQHEILRELGAVDLATGKPEEARQMLADYVDRRPYDPEGLYYYGQALATTGATSPARTAYEQAIEAARTAPRYRQGITAKWGRLAQRALSSLR